MPTGENQRWESLRLNLLILLGYRNAVSIDTAMNVRDILTIASDPEMTDGTRYMEAEVDAALQSLYQEENIRGNGDPADDPDSSPASWPQIAVYITALGILNVKKFIEGGAKKAESTDS